MPKIELGKWDLFCKIQKFSDRGVKISEVGEWNFLQVGESNSKMVEWGRQWFERGSNWVQIPRGGASPTSPYCPPLIILCTTDAEIQYDPLISGGNDPLRANKLCSGGALGHLTLMLLWPITLLDLWRSHAKMGDCYYHRTRVPFNSL